MSGPGTPAPARVAGLLLLAAFAALCAHGLRWDSPTVDEFAHLPAGYYYLKTGNFDLYDLNPPLPRILSALPLLAVAPSTRCLCGGATTAPTRSATRRATRSWRWPIR